MSHYACSLPVQVLANRNAELAVPPLFWPVNCIKIGGHVALLSCLSIYFLFYRVVANFTFPSSSSSSNFQPPFCSLPGSSGVAHPAPSLNPILQQAFTSLIIDEHLTWKNHVNNISKKISSGISALKRVRPFINRETAVKAYRGLVEPYFTYCCPVWDGIGLKLSEKLQKLQNRAARAITSHEVSSAFLLSELGWNDLAKNRVKQKAILMYKDNNYCAHQYLQQLFTPNVSRYDLRNSLNKLSVPKPRTD